MVYNLYTYTVFIWEKWANSWLYLYRVFKQTHGEVLSSFLVGCLSCQETAAKWLIVHQWHIVILEATADGTPQKHKNNENFTWQTFGTDFFVLEFGSCEFNRSFHSTNGTPFSVTPSWAAGNFHFHPDAVLEKRQDIYRTPQAQKQTIFLSHQHKLEGRHLKKSSEASIYHATFHIAGLPSSIGLSFLSFLLKYADFFSKYIFRYIFILFRALSFCWAIFFTKLNLPERHQKSRHCWSQHRKSCRANFGRRDTAYETLGGGKWCRDMKNLRNT